MNENNPVKQSLDTLAFWGSLLLLGSGLFGQMTGLFTFEARIGIWLLLCLLSFGAAIQGFKKVKRRTEFSNLRNEQIDIEELSPWRFYWLNAGGAFGLILLCELFTGGSVLFKPVQVRSPQFGLADRQHEAQAHLDKETRILGIQSNGMQPIDAQDFKSDLIEFDESKQADYQRRSALRDRLVYDSQDAAFPLKNAKDAARFYHWPLAEHFGFDVQKRKYVGDVVIDDVEVTVDNFISMPQVAAPAGPVSNRDIIIVELAKKKTPLPWTFNAAYLLDDPKSKNAKAWGKQLVVLTDESLKGYLVKISARDPGVYVYRVDLLVHAGVAGRQTRIPLVPFKRSCWFYGGTTGSLIPPSGEPDAAPAAPAAPAAAVEPVK